MDWYKSYRLVKNGDRYDVIIFLNPNCTEFSREFAANFKENILGFDEQIREFVKDKFSDVKIHTVKLVLGSLAVATMPFMTLSKAHAEELAPSNTQKSASSSLISLNTTGVVTALKLNVRQGPSTNYARIHYLWKGNKVKVTGQLGTWYRIKLSDGREGWVSKTFLYVDTRQQKISQVVSTGRALVGTPYVWGGESFEEGGFDCSGFTQYVFKQAGYDLPRVSSQQANYGTGVSRSSIQPGDLVFYSMQANGVVSHVGLYIGNGQMIHSPKPGDAVKITNMTTSYWESRFITARRII